MEILEPRFGRGGEGRRYTGYELGSRVFRLDPVQDFGVWAMTFHGGHQCGSSSLGMREEDVPDAEYQLQSRTQRGGRNDIRSGAGPGSIRGFLGEMIQEYASKVDGFPEPIREWMFAQDELGPTAKCSPHYQSSDHQFQRCRL